MRGSLPRAWVFAGLLQDLTPGQVLPVDLPGSPRVLFRTASGRVVVMDAHCPHVGTHLGRGGTVEDECIRCPLHGLRFDASGACLTRRATPPLQLSDGEPLELARHAATIVAGIIFTWFDPAGGTPDFDLPQLDDAEFLPYRVRTEVLSLPMEEPLEVHAVDIAHNETLHGESDVVAEEPFSVEHHRTHASLTMRHPATPAGLLLLRGLGIRDGLVETHVEVTTVGLGYQHIRSRVASLSIEVNQFMLSVPQGIDQTVFHIIYSLRRPRRSELPLLMRPLPPALLEQSFDRLGYIELMAAIDEHAAIWKHKRHLARPGLVRGDEQVATFRRWTDTFYPTADTEEGEPS